MFEHITANEIAGYAFGALLLGATISAPKIDSFISVAQRRSLGMCRKCGDLKLITCSNCKGAGSFKERGAFNFSLFDEGDQPFGAKSKVVLLSCTKCQGRGHFRCKECFKPPAS